jgi:hypothetical protein
VTAWKNHLGIHKSYHAVYEGGKDDGVATSDVKYSSAALEAEHLGELMLALAGSPAAPATDWRGWYGEELFADIVSQMVSQMAPRMNSDFS